MQGTGDNSSAGDDGKLATVSDPAEHARLVLLQRSGLFDGAWFAARNADVAAAGHAALIHWHRQGWRENRWPNLYFDTAYYRRRHDDAAQADPLLHYIQWGEAAGYRPVPYFDPAWYRARYGIAPDQLCLAHFLRHRFTGDFSPIPEFDSQHYLRSNPDVAAAGLDPLEHYLIQGFREDRKPTAEFDLSRHGHSRSRHANPLLDLLQARERAGPRATGADIASEMRRNTTAHPAFEEVAPLPLGAALKAKLLAYYLPQFHPVPENDASWGRGFTEWTNLQRALPRFAGHYQPRIPRDIGHYRLDQGDTLRRQIALARGAGLHGFVHYFYWFNGRRVMNGPLEAMLADPAIDFPFCLMWANENWTRRWDGSDDMVLLSQDYRTADEDTLLAEFARHFADPRHIRLAQRPVLMIYRPRLIPDTAVTLARWRARFRDGFGENPVFVMAQSFGDTDPRPFGMDAAIEFPPHKLTEVLSVVNEELELLDPAFTAEVYDYAALAQAATTGPAPPFPLIKTACPGWDNDPRRQGAGLVLRGSTPAAYQAWLAELIHLAQANPVFGESLVCINAWNEWAEGAYLEPDVHFGGAYLNATGRAAAGLAPPDARTRILLVGHDAHPHGAQTLLLHIGRTLRRVHGVEVSFLLLAGGALEAEYAATAPLQIARDGPHLAELAAAARAAGCSGALVNTAAAAHARAVLGRHGIASALLVHELPRLIHEKGLQAGLREGVAAAAHVVFAAEFVRESCHALVALDPARVEILPQGLYAPAAPNPAARAAIRAELRVPAGGLLAIGMGYADLRKGFDLFLQAWRAVQHAPVPVHFAWAGGIDGAIESYLAPEIAAAEATGRFRYLGQRADPGDILAAADAFLLTSREDPLPSVALEAMSAGTPVIAFEETGGIGEVIAQLQGGACVPLGDAAAMAQAMLAAAAAGPADAARLAQDTARAFGFPRYCARLLTLAAPALPAISVAVPAYNYARYMPGRLASIFAQSHPVHEVIVLHDASSDDSVAVARAVAESWQRDIRLDLRTRNSGSVFAQWRRAAEAATGDWLWIAEADDACDPLMLGRLAAAIASARDPVLAFCDSRAIDEAGQTLSPDYKPYYARTAPGLLTADGVFEGGAFLRTHLAARNLILNASAVLWRRRDLLAALRRCEADLKRLRLAGDWRLYAEMLARTGAQIAYVAAPLNHHRRHPHSVTARMSEDAHGAEIAHMHAVMARLTGVRTQTNQRIRRYRKSLAK